MKKFLKGMLLIITMLFITVASVATVRASEITNEFYKNDITPPWGRIYIEGAATKDGVTYVGEKTLNIKIYAKDDMCKDSEIKYYMSETPISSTEKLADNLWKTYIAGEAMELTLKDDGTLDIYAIFKDANGNTSLIYEANSNATQNIVFNANGGTGAPTGVDTNRVLGMSYILPTQTPYKSEHVFLGWSTDSMATAASYKAGDAIPADASLGNEETIILYAIYGTDVSEYPNLVDVVEVGDYVNYPVGYDNVVTYVEASGTERTSYISKLNGWRVLSGDKETGEVTLISAGVPLTIYKSTASTAQTIANKMASTTEFLNIGFTTNQTDGKLRKNGFGGYSSLVEAFTNKYTVINSGIPEVRAMTKSDVDSVYQYLGGTTSVTTLNTYIYDAKYKDMFMVPSTTSGNWSYVWLGSAHSSTELWFLSGLYGYIDNDFISYLKEGLELGVRPVVTIKAGIKAIGQDIDGAWNIATEDEIVKIPTIRKGEFLHDGNEHEVILTNFNSDLMEITGTKKATALGTYTATVSLKDTTKYTWTDGTTEPKEFEWEINTGHIYVTLYTDGTLGFSNDESTIEGKTVSKSYGDIAKSHYTSLEEVPWCLERKSIITVDFVNEVVPYYSTAYWFRECSNLTIVNNISKLNTVNVTDMTRMFSLCNSIKTLDLRNFDTSNVTSMFSMFYQCNSLESVNVSSFDTSKVINMESMFNECHVLKTLDLSSFDTSNVTNMLAMFERCESLENLNLSNFNTSNVTNMNWLFYQCYALENVNISNFNTSQVTEMESMFNECYALKTLDLSSFDTSNVTNMLAMFMKCHALESIKLSSFNTSKVTNMESMFNECKALTSLDLSSFNTGNATNMTYMFYNSTNLGEILVSSTWTTSQADTTAMFLNCKAQSVTLKTN